MFFTDILSLFYPRLCAGCNASLIKGEDVLCLACLADLPKMDFSDPEQNLITDMFIGRANIMFAASFLLFEKGGKVQHLIHQLKYNGKKEVGVKMGLLFGYELNLIPSFKKIDIIIPVPLHKRKQRIRGYNQSVEICKGISESLKKPLITGNLIRNMHTPSQTLKGRYQRWENVSGMFSVKNQKTFEGKHLLLVDDVVTTGATLEACCEVLLKIPCVKVSIAALAKA